MNKQQLASKIWESANKMRSKIEANEYKDYILGFMFYKFLSDKEVKWLKENDWTDEYLPDLTEDDAETLDTVRKNVGYFIAYENLFSTWISKGSDFKADDVTVALQACGQSDFSDGPNRVGHSEPERIPQLCRGKRGGAGYREHGCSCGQAEKYFAVRYAHRDFHPEDEQYQG